MCICWGSRQSPQAIFLRAPPRFDALPSLAARPQCFPGSEGSLPLSMRGLIDRRLPSLEGLTNAVADMAKFVYVEEEEKKEDDNRLLHVILY